MKAIAVIAGTPDTVHLADLEKPSVTDVADGRGVLVQVLECGVDGTDKEINHADYGNAPPGYDFLVLGHENFGRIVEIGPNVTGFEVGDYVSATVRRPGNSFYDDIGYCDMTMEDTYYERGINLLHGFLTEYYVEDMEFLVKVPENLKHVGVLMEPVSVVEKGIMQAFEIQRRLKIWRPKTALVTGSGAIGQLATMVLRLMGLEVSTISRSEKEGNFKAELVEELGAVYMSSREHSLAEICEARGPFDLVFEATGSSKVAFGCMELLQKNGILCLTSITGGDAVNEVPTDKVNIDFVLNNKVMFGTVNANMEAYVQGVKDFAHSENAYPGWLSKLLTHPIEGLENFQQMMDTLVNDRAALKVYVKIAE
ncbi:MAG: glucose 1-dehydrogenase [Lentisphaeria bacterium]|nr:glucose 1-dehydrogenase [Lentisphaeria bacterium]NQZ66694.1 glucose 1-dehydrogenase [Lentisphaeria bacterium]